MKQPLRSSKAKVTRTIQTYSAPHAQKTADPFYLSPEWRGLMAKIIKQRGRFCEDPQHDPRKPRSGIRLFGDHIIERQDGGLDLDPRNIMLRCGSCHTRKTAQSRADRR